MKTIASLLFAIFTFSAIAQDAKEIIRKADEKNRGNSSKGEVTIKIQRPKWSREMTMKTWSYGTDYSMTLVTSPAKEKGMGFLKREKEVWNWVPRVERLIKLPPSMMMQSWMGTDFTNDDLVKQSSIVDDYDHKILGDSTIENRKCWKIEMIPHEDAAVVWGKVVVWIDQQEYIQMKVKSFDEDGFLVSTLNAFDVKNMGGKVIATRLEMIPADKENHKTIFIQNSMEFDVKDLNPDFFTPQNLKRIRL
ncbi:MAG: outer membrane lipoprotein-sorting protein [Bacteroidia bacterium]